ncbi:amidohydrolase family protein [Subtercola lobariae]|uniref:Cytosine deaminase n=1 Tax=Subtercola lobariae TaxID=1588641 RepID=A0A917B4G5_9MICO|nr:amidohydrolase family protein [Subtercola lobariae]GGF22978.1 cytosine deaminase [Subtercola lobariae]
MTFDSANDEIFDRIQSTAGDATRKLLLRGGTIITMDARLGDFARGDVLIEGNAIVDVGHDLSSAATDGQAIVVDLDGAIVIPGLHDTHRHSWQGQFRRLLPDADVVEYNRVMHRLLAPLYRPEDMYAGNLISALGAIDSGITGILDFSHNARTPEHSDASIDAWEDAGIRAIYAPCAPLFGEWQHQWPSDLRRLREERFASADQLVSLRLGVLSQAVGKTLPQSDEGAQLSENALRFARELGLAVSVDGVGGPVAAEQLERLGAAGMLGSDTTYIHCRDLTDAAWQEIVASRGNVSLAPASAAQFGQPGSISPIQKVLDVGLRPSLSLDVECSLPTDMFAQMRYLLNIQRTGAANGPVESRPDAPTAITARDVLEFATVQGAKANGLLDRCGSLTPGKDADIVIIRADTINTLPLNNAIGSVVLGDTSNIDNVLIAGQMRKWRGHIVYHDIEKVRRLVTESRDHLIEISGYDLNIVR